MLYVLHPTVSEEVSTIVKILTLHHGVTGYRTYNDSDSFGGLSQFLNYGLGLIYEVVKLQKIPWWIANSRQLRKDDNIRTLSLGASRILQHFSQVSIEISYVNVDLGKGDVHNGYIWLRQR